MVNHGDTVSAESRVRSELTSCAEGFEGVLGGMFGGAAMGDDLHQHISDNAGPQRMSRNNHAASFTGRRGASGSGMLSKLPT